MTKRFTFFICFIACLFSASVSFPQSGWVYQSPLFKNTDFKSSSFLNVSIGFAAGTDGVIAKTTNMGFKWSIILKVNNVNFNSILFRSSTGWAAGTKGRIVKTTDEGISWTTLVSGTNKTLKSIFFIDNSTGYICGDSGVVLKTVNGGSDWSLQTLGVSSFTSVNFVNSATGYCFGPASQFYKTTDGGATWSPQPANFPAVLSSYFVNAATGFAAAENGIWRSTNSGANWVNVYPGSSTLHSLSFLNSTTGYAAGANGTILKTTNTGNSWTGIQSSGFTHDNFSVYFADQNYGYVFGARGRILRTSSGSDWYEYRDYVTKDYISAVKFLTPYIGWACTESTFLRTDDGGETWSTSTLESEGLLSSGFYNMYDLYFIDPNTGWVTATGTNQGVRKTVDGGKSFTWQLLLGAINQDYSRCVHMLNALTGYCTGGDYHKTTNGGANWFEVNNPDWGYNTVDIHFANAQTGWAVLDFNGSTKLYKTINGASSWSLQSSNTASKSTVFFIDAFTGWTAGPGNVQRTTDGGSTWMSSSVAALALAGKMQFINAQTGWLGGYNGRIFSTTNGGANWSYKTIASGKLTDVSFIDENTGWTVSADGEILRTTTGGNVFISQISSEIPENYLLKQNYPNPFNPSTKINYEIKSPGFISLKVFDLLGKEVAVLVNEKQNAGSYAVDFNSAEFNLPSGIYFYTLRAGEFIETRKMVLVK